MRSVLLLTRLPNYNLLVSLRKVSYLGVPRLPGFEACGPAKPPLSTPNFKQLWRLLSLQTNVIPNAVRNLKGLRCIFLEMSRYARHDNALQCFFFEMSHCVRHDNG